MARVSGWVVDLLAPIGDERLAPLRGRAVNLLPDLLKLLGDQAANKPDEVRDRAIRIARDYAVWADIAVRSPSIAAIRDECEELAVWAANGRARLYSLGPWLESERLAPWGTAERLRAMLDQVLEVARNAASRAKAQGAPAKPILRARPKHGLVIDVLDLFESYRAEVWSSKHSEFCRCVSLVHEIATGNPAELERPIKSVMAARRRERDARARGESTP